MKQINYCLLLSFLVLSCSKEEDTTNEPSKNASDYWYCQLDGQQKSLAIITGLEDLEAYLHIESSIAGVGMGVSHFKLSSGLFDSNTESGFLITKGTMDIPQGGFPTSLQFFDFMNVQSNNFSPSGINGIEVEYVDDQLDIWSTSLGPQIGSTFKFTKLTPMTLLGEEIIITESEFECTLYNSTGQKKILTNGKAKLTFQYQ